MDCLSQKGKIGTEQTLDNAFVLGVSLKITGATNDFVIRK